MDWLSHLVWLLLAVSAVSVFGYVSYHVLNELDLEGKWREPWVRILILSWVPVVACLVLVGSAHARSRYLFCDIDLTLGYKEVFETLSEVYP